MKLRGTLLVIAFVVVVSLQTVSLGYAALFLSPTTTATYLLHVLFAIYLSILAVQSVGKNMIGSHFRNVIHLSVLTTLTFALLGFTALFPRDAASISAPAVDSRPHFLQAIWYVVLVLYGLSTVVAVTTPLGPPLHFPVSRIYSEKTVAAITNQAADNVSGATGLCPLVLYLLPLTRVQVPQSGVSFSSRILQKLSFLVTLQSRSI